MKPQVEQLFHEVVDLSETDRARHIEASGAGADTRAQLDRLLSFASNTNPLLQGDIGQMAAHALDRLTPLDTPAALRCGPYLTTELLGRGGMGAVYLAERVDGEVTQKVAIKLLRTGSDDPQTRLRFLAERQILADLSHPNVARLLDVGHTENGQPYLVMEYVEGKPLDTWAGKAGLRDILQVFLKVCAAVGYLHRNLVVHRDLKPANILVTPGGEPKLLDFGIAKILDVAADTAATGMRMLTPDYASPEQVTGHGVSTSTDVYSLGAVLYKLLTGQPPHRFANETPGEIIRQISSGEIAAPSTISPLVRGDLEFVLMKALRTEPHERYATVEQFSEDLENYLEMRPVRARKGERWYRAQKFIRRHWVYAAAGALALGSMAIGLYVANRERVVAERRFAQLRQLSRRVADVDGPIRALPGSVEVRQKLVAASLEYLEGLRPEAAGDPDVAQDVADGYWRMARIQGVNTDFNLGDPAKAEDSLKKAQQLMDAVLAARPGDANALLRSAVIAHDRMLLADTEERRAEALAFAKVGVMRMEALLRLPPGKVEFEGFLRSNDGPQPERTRVAAMMGNVALAHVNLHLYADGAGYARRAIEISESLPAKAAMAPRVQGLGVLANALRYQGDLDGALAAIQEARQVVEHGSYDSEAARFFSRYGILLREGMVLGETGAPSLNRPEAAIPVLEEALALTESTAKKDARDSASRGRVGTVGRLLGGMLSEHEPKHALEVFDLGIKRLGEAGKSVVNRRERATLLARSAAPLRRLGRGAEAQSRLEEAFTILQDTGDYPRDQFRIGSPAWTVVSAQADDAGASGNVRGGIEQYERLLAAVGDTRAEAENDLRDAPKLSSLYEAMARLYRRSGDEPRALEMAGRRAALWAQWQRRLPENRYVSRQAEGPKEGL